MAPRSSSFYTVYAGLGATDVQVGDWVGMSTRLGTLENMGPEAILFFEVRRAFCLRRVTLALVAAHPIEGARARPAIAVWLENRRA